MTDIDDGAETRYTKRSKQKSLDLSELNGMTNKELIDKIIQLEAYNTQLKNLLQKKCEHQSCSAKMVQMKRKFNSERFGKRHILLKLYYLGWDSQGFVCQDDTINTIEYHLFKALEKCCLIEKRESSNYQRCGRTDKGVSAFCQVISLDVRSKFMKPTADNCNDELPYLTMLNRLLPDHIRCYAWAHVPPNIGARFDCTARGYQYYFPAGNLNISLMKDGVKQLVGKHDFRNFCKMDVGNGVTKFVRSIIYADIQPCFKKDIGDDYNMYKLIIRGNGFLWHQIRCIMTLLILIGQEKESPDIISKLLNVTENPTKPQYVMANHTPLTLFVSDYESLQVTWNTNDKELSTILHLLQKQWTIYSVKEVMIKDIIDELSKLKKEDFQVRNQCETLLGGKESKSYRPLLTRMKCASLEDRIEHYVKRRKLVKEIEHNEKT